MTGIPSQFDNLGAVAPVTNAFVITPNDSTELEIVPRCLILNVAAVLKMDLLGGSTGVSVPLQPGFNPIRPTKVYATGTDSGVTIVGGY